MPSCDYLRGRLGDSRRLPCRRDKMGLFYTNHDMAIFVVEAVDRDGTSTVERDHSYNNFVASVFDRA
jgi:hypothetical protein